MASTFTSISIHFVFAVSGRENALTDSFRDDLHKYITGIVQHKKHKMLEINSVEDHIHMFVGLHPTQSIADVMREVKANSSRFINQARRSNRKFEWQEGYAAFSHSRSQRSQVIKYIQNQREHHRHRTFKEEIREILEKFDIPYDEQYLFDDFS